MMLITRRDDDVKPVAVWYLSDGKNNISGRAEAGDGAGDMTSNNSRQRQHERTAKQHGLCVNGTACCQQINSTEIILHACTMHISIKNSPQLTEKLSFTLTFTAENNDSEPAEMTADLTKESTIRCHHCHYYLLSTAAVLLKICQLLAVLLLTLWCILKWCPKQKLQ